MDPKQKGILCPLTAGMRARRSAWTFRAAVIAGALACQPAPAQQELAQGVAAGAIGCAPSNNGTGHMVCVAYTTAGVLEPISWQAPPAPKGSEVSGTVDHLALIAPLAGTPVGVPGCAPTNDGAATASCLIVSSGTSGLRLQGLRFYPPAGLVSGLQDFGNAPAAPVGNPGCTGVGSGATAAVFCAIVANGQAYGIAFNPQVTGQPGAVVNTTLAKLSAPTLPSLANVIGNPTCSSQFVPAGQVGFAVCAVRQGTGVTGFTVQYTPPTATAPAAVSYVAAIQLPGAPFSGDPSCAVIGDGTNTVNCAIVSGTALLGTTFNPQAGTMLNAYRSLGSAPDTGQWNGSVGCSSFRTTGNQDGNLTSCAVVSSSSNVFSVTFDGSTGVNLGPYGPFSFNVNSQPSCLPLATDIDLLFCGVTTANATAGGSVLPVGILGPAAAEAAVSVLF